MSGLSVTDLHKSFGTRPVLRGLELTVPPGSFTAILGASGSGKTTLLRLLAGFERPDRGTIRIGDGVVDDAHHHVRPERRRIGYVPQEGSLFPHLSVEANIAFGLKRSERHRVADLVDLVGLGEFRHRYPHQLSGGQQQRVALARALAVKPEIVLLDEPFASLDTHMRAHVRNDVRTILHDAHATALLVTHDQDEALSVADLVAVLRSGTIAQLDTPNNLYATPVDADLARFVGDANLLDGTLNGPLVDTPLGTLTVCFHDHLPTAPCPVTVLLRPEQILVEPGETDGRLTALVTSVDYHGHASTAHIETGPSHGGLTLVGKAAADIYVKRGTRVTATVHGPVHVWPRQPPEHTGARPDRAGSGRATPLISSESSR